MSHVREPVVSGAFYPSNESALRQQLSELFGGVVKRAERGLSGPVGIVALRRCPMSNANVDYSE